MAVGVRFVLGLDTAGKPAQVRLISDGGKYPVRRITCIHSKDAPKGRGTVGVWVRCAEGLDERGFVAFEKKFSAEKAKADVKAGRVDISAAGMRLEADVDNERRIACQGGR